MSGAALPRSAAYARLCFIASEMDWDLGLGWEACDPLPIRWTLNLWRPESKDPVVASAHHEQLSAILGPLCVKLEERVREALWLRPGEWPQ